MTSEHKELNAGEAAPHAARFAVHRIADPFARGGWRFTLRTMSRTSRFVSYGSDIHTSGIVHFAIDDEAPVYVGAQAVAEEKDEEDEALAEIYMESMARVLERASEKADEVMAGLLSLSSALKQGL